MGEARRKKLAGNTEVSNPNWKRTKKFTRKMERDLLSDVSKAMGVYGLLKY